MTGTKNKIEDLRNHLFETLEALKDPDKPMEIDRGKAIANVANSIILSAKLEVDYLKVTGGTKTGTGFIPEERQLGPAPDNQAARRFKAQK